MRFRYFVSCLLAGALSAAAQQAVPAEAAKLVSQQPQGTLKINVVEGEGARNSVKNRVAVPPVVEVKDASDKIVTGAEVVFQLPLAGPGGAFNGWLRTQTVRTDENGKATVSGYTPNTEAGRFNIKVTATMGSQTGSAVIAQINVEGASDSTAVSGGGAPKTPAGMKKALPWKFIGPAIGAAAIGGIAAALRGGNGTTTSTTNPVPVGISAGAITVGVPR
ncbi:MAG: hypothetical protein IT162_23610 [Bryobacterales bacterium]|nr:hypothetical protein [Bryobacterales bacterium]